MDTCIALLGKENFKTHGALCVLAESHLGLGNLKIAKALFENSLEFYKKNEEINTYWIEWTLSGLGRVYLAEGNFEKAEHFFQQSIAILQNKLDDTGIYIALERLAEIYEKKALEAAQKNDLVQSAIFRNKAKNFLEQALQRIKLKFSDNTSPVLRMQNKLRTLQANR